MWTFDQQFVGLQGNDYYTLVLNGTTVDLYQSTSSLLGTLIASGPETGAYATNLPTPAVPEPATFGIAGLAGLVAIAMGRFTRARKN